MLKITLALACLALAGYGRRMQEPCAQLQRRRSLWTDDPQEIKAHGPASPGGTYQRALYESFASSASALKRLAAICLRSTSIAAFNVNSASPVPAYATSLVGHRFQVISRVDEPKNDNIEAGQLIFEGPAVSRRAMLQLALYPASAALGVAGLPLAANSKGNKEDRRYGPLLQGPFDFPSASRATVRQELFPGRMWSFEQVQGVIYVHVPVRMTVVKLDSGGLFVYAPVAPTTECLRLLAEVEAEHGGVAHILLPTLALEHKSFAGAFANARPKAQLWLASAQYSFPLNLPLPLTGLPARAKLLPPESKASTVPWASQLPYRTLGPLKQQAGAAQEVVVLDRPTGALLVTDLVISVPTTPPAVLAANDLRALLYHARDDPSETPVDTPEKRMEGWQKICLFALYFQQSSLYVPAEPDGTLSGTIKFFGNAFPPMPAAGRALGWNGFFAWRWRSSWPRTFEALRNGGRPVVPPILQEIVLARDVDEVLQFVERVAQDLPFTSIVPAHFDAPIKAGPREWKEAFRPFTTIGYDYPGAMPAADLDFLREFENKLIAVGAIRPRSPRTKTLQP